MALSAFAALLDEHEGIVNRILHARKEPSQADLKRLEEIEVQVDAWVEDEDYNRNQPEA